MHLINVPNLEPRSANRTTHTITKKEAPLPHPPKNKEHEKHRQKSKHDVFDHTQTKCKTCPKTKKKMDPANSIENSTKVKTKLFLTLENTVQDYVWTKLKNRHNGHKLQKLVSRCPCMQYKTSYIGAKQIPQNDTRTS
jgi:hypothetical protein